MELRDPDLARQYVLQGMLLARSAPLSPDLLEQSLSLAKELTADGSVLPPMGFLIDVVHIASGNWRRRTANKSRSLVSLDDSLVRRYEDYVVGKLYNDMSFERACLAADQYSETDYELALVYLIRQISSRCGLPGAIVAPGVIGRLQNVSLDEFSAEAIAGIEQSAFSPELLDCFERLILKVRNVGQLLGSEDIFELESGTALQQFGQRLALRQVLYVADVMLRALPNHRPTGRPKHASVSTNIVAEDQYPVGGFTSLSNRGTIESLLRSELAYIEDDERPDLFDIKFARDELLYYSRDENQFLRRRMSVVIAIYPHLKQARFKDEGVPAQRIILALAFVYTLVRQLATWMSQEALRFEILLVDDAAGQLKNEVDLLRVLFHEEIGAEVLVIEEASANQVASRNNELNRTSLCQCVSVGSQAMSFWEDRWLQYQLIVDGPRPTLWTEDQVIEAEACDLASWQLLLSGLLPQMV